MNSNQQQIPLKGSTRYAMPNARVIGEAPPGEFQVTVMVKRRAELPSSGAHLAERVRERTYLTRDQHTARYGAEPGDLQKVEAFAGQNGLRVVGSNAVHRCVTLMGTTEAYSKAFGVKLQMCESGGKTYRGREGNIFLPESLDGIVTSVTGLDNRQFAKPHFRIHRQVAQAAGAGGTSHAAARAASSPPVVPNICFSPSDASLSNCTIT